MGDETADAVADQAIDQGPESAEDVSVADAGQGSRRPGRDADQAGEKPSKRPQPSDDDGDDDLTEALVSGSLDEVDVDRDGKVHAREKRPAKPTPKAKPEPEEQPEGETAEEAEPKGEAEADQPGETEAEGDKPDAEDELSDTDKQLLERARTKKQRDDLQNLFKERTKLRTDLKGATEAKTFADNVIRHAQSAGISKPEELATLIEQEKFLRSQPKEKAAEYLRKWADTIDPPKPADKPVTLSKERQEAVDAGFLTKEDAELLERAKAPKEEPKPPERREEAPVDQASARAQAERAGYADVAKIATAYQQRHGAEWASIAKEVKKQLESRLPDLKTEAWGREAKRLIDAEVLKRQRAAVKKPTKTIAPRGAPAKRADDIESEEDELDGLMSGNLT